LTAVEKIILMITGTVCLILILSSVGPLITGRALTETKAKMLVGVIGSLVAIISMYIGRRGGR